MDQTIPNENDLTPERGTLLDSPSKRATGQVADGVDDYDSESEPEFFGQIELTTVSGLTLEQLRKILKACSKANAGINNLALELGVTGQFLGAVIAGIKNPGPKLLKALHYREIVLYVPADDFYDELPAESPTSLNPQQETD
jgi:hypothetical protein